MRASAVVRVFFLVLGFGSLVLGYFGFQQYLRTRTGYGTGVADLLYYDLQLLVLDPAPFDQGGPYGWRLEVARFGAPLATAYALAEAGRALFADQGRRMVVRWLRGHVLLCGDGPAAEMLMPRLLEAGKRVVTIGAGPDARPGPDHFHLQGDAQDAAALEAAGIGRAEAVYAFSADSAENARIALTAAAAPRRSDGRLTAYAHVENVEMCQALRARRLGMSEESAFRLDFVNPAELSVRVLLERRPLPAGLRHIMIVGLSDFGRALLVELGRRLRFAEGTGTTRPKLTLVGRAATAVAADLSGRYAFLGLWDIVTHDEAPADFNLLAWSGARGADELPDRVFLCDADPEVSLRGALTAVPLWRGAESSLVVCVPRRVVFGDAFAAEARLLDDLSGVLQVVGILDDACDPERIGDDLVEQLGRAFHEHYVLSRRSAGETEADNALLIPWDRLAEQYKQSNRDQAAHLGAKLKAADCLLAPSTAGAAPFAFTAEEIERLARMEHRRWTGERTASGWRHGTIRDDSRKIHPSMVDWSVLPETERNKDRNAVAAIPAALADAGFQIVRR